MHARVTALNSKKTKQNLQPLLRNSSMTICQVLSSDRLRIFISYHIHHKKGEDCSWPPLFASLAFCLTGLFVPHTMTLTSQVFRSGQ